MKENFEQAAEKPGDKFVADERKKYHAMVDRAIETGTISPSLAVLLKKPEIEAIVRISVTSEREFKTAIITTWKDCGMYAKCAKFVGAENDEDVAACVDAMCALAASGLKDAIFGFVPSADDTSDSAFYTRRYPGKILPNPPSLGVV